MTLERLQELNRRLAALLQDPQEGLMTWNGFLDEVMSSLVKEWGVPETDSTDRFEIDDDEFDLCVHDLATDPDDEDVRIVRISGQYGSKEGRMSLAKKIITILDIMSENGKENK